jgi:hypothetical protein
MLTVYVDIRYCREVCGSQSFVCLFLCQAGINYFRISNKAKPVDQGTPEGWSDLLDDNKTADSTLNVITSDNARLRQNLTGKQVEEKTFEIELQESLCEMRPDTQLVVIDIPGINEARISDKYKNWVSNNWDTFDCAIVVMDGKHGVNTDTQVG